jgi:hypothetical protein
MIVPRFKCKFDKDHLVYERPDIFCAYIQGIAEKGDIEATFQPWRKEKSLQQLRYVHGIVFVLCSQASGYTAMEIKGLLKSKFLTEYVISKKTGKEIPIVKSLADLTMTEMKQFIDDCKMLAAEQWSCVIPDSDDVKV